MVGGSQFSFPIMIAVVVTGGLTILVCLYGLIFRAGVHGYVDSETGRFGISLDPPALAASSRDGPRPVADSSAGGEARRPQSDRDSASRST